ncbi:Protein of unknown function [Pseudomonas sp. NFACC10-1]|jgi:hypothetical protein|nr:Protein of unknown function [Pseudomonas syringae]SFW81795.1 Protein of unknown function [Pseudomonas sp. NFACC10-1]
MSQAGNFIPSGMTFQLHLLINTNVKRELTMGIGTILIIVLILLLVGGLPVFPHSRSWGYGPSGIIGTILVILLILVLLGKI